MTPSIFICTMKVITSGSVPSFSLLKDSREMILSMRTIREDLFLTAYAAFIAELTDKGTEEKKPNPYLFELILESFKRLNDGTDPDVITFIVHIGTLYGSFSKQRWQINPLSLIEK
jgi:DNA repair protein RecO